MTKLTITLAETELRIARANTSCTATTTDPGSSYTPKLRSINLQADIDAGQRVASLDGPGPEALPWPPGLRAAGLYIRALAEYGAPYTLTLTRELSGPDALDVRGMVLLELPEDDRVTAVSVTGAGEFEWAAWGSK